MIFFFFLNHSVSKHEKNWPGKMFYFLLHSWAECVWGVAVLRGRREPQTQWSLRVREVVAPRSTPQPAIGMDGGCEHPAQAADPSP